MELIQKNGFKINCKNCLEKCDKSDAIQINMSGDGGYSNYTVMDDGAVEFKCLTCGKFGSSDEYKKPNEIKNFTIRCLECDAMDRVEYHIQDVDEVSEKTNMTCTKCGNRVIGNN